MGSRGVINGVNLDRLSEIVKAFKAMPSLARFRFRAENRWIGGGHSVTTVKDFYGARREASSRNAAFEVHADEPAVLLGDDQGANPVEHVLAALASCLTTSLVYHAAAGGSRLRRSSLISRAISTFGAFWDSRWVCGRATSASG